MIQAVAKCSRLYHVWAMMIRSAAALSALLLCTSAAPAPSPANLALAAALAANMCGQSEGTGAEAARGAIVLVPGLTPAHMPVSDMPAAQAYFDQGLGQLWGFDYDEALVSFRVARRRDPACAR
jgi:hypothetical protein